MLYSYFQLSFRHLYRRTFYHGINIFGLSVGLAVVAIVFLYAYHENSYDSFHTQSKNIVRISSKRGDTWFGTLSPIHSRFLLDKNLPEVEQTVRLRRYPPKYISHGNEKFFESKVLFTDTGSNFFDLFDFPILYGNKTIVFREQNSVVLTESVAQKLFGKDNAVGETFVFDTLQLKVTAVLRNLPSNTHMDFAMVICNNQITDKASGLFTYGLLSTNANVEELKGKLMAVSSPANKFDFLQDCKIIPLRDLHYEANMTFELKPAGNKAFLLIFGAIGIMITLLSCFNFVNLSLAIYTQRAKEIAVRKVIGASRKSVAAQFHLESVVLSLLCFPFALTLLELALPSFNSFMGIRLSNQFVQDGLWFFGALLVTLAIGFQAGIYPAWILPRINAIVLFKKGLITVGSNFGVRSVLVGFQVLIMVIMLSGSWIIEDQLKFIQDKDLGFDKEGVFKLEGAGMVDSAQFATLKARLLSNHTISQVSHGLVPGDEDYGTPYRLDGTDDISNNLIAYPVGREYLTTMGMQILQADYEPAAQTLPNRVVLVNETFAKQIGENCIGKRIVLNPGKDYESIRTINGIFKDVHFRSLHEPIVPMMISFRNESTIPNQNILVKIDKRNKEEAAAFIKKTALETIHKIPLSLRPLDESLEKYYEKEQKLLFFSRILLGFTVVLSILGFIGLSSYVTELRSKEIGIRKILGATTFQLVLTLSRFFIHVTIVAFVLGSIISFLFMKNWLQSFSYQTIINAIPFAITLLGLCLTLLVSVGWHSLRAANANPVDSLRSE